MAVLLYQQMPSTCEHLIPSFAPPRARRHRRCGLDAEFWNGGTTAIRAATFGSTYEPPPPPPQPDLSISLSAASVLVPVVGPVLSSSTKATRHHRPFDPSGVGAAHFLRIPSTTANAGEWQEHESQGRQPQNALHPPNTPLGQRPHRRRVPPASTYVPPKAGERARESLQHVDIDHNPDFPGASRKPIQRRCRLVKPGIERSTMAADARGDESQMRARCV
ncbi:hypothetical protein R3P38DRAFT_3170279 [Favolaschia claudopus]|uniref:Uncharacterized protein n=1 Tax=Favolaschia claudopus TaxID=2862362 RepID=A0AAW0DSP2_9AGAR